MTHWMKSAYQRVMARFARPAQTTERRGPSRKITGVSTVEYALIVVAVVGIITAGVAILGEDFQGLFDQLGDEMATAENIGDAAEAATTPAP